MMRISSILGLWFLMILSMIAWGDTLRLSLAAGVGVPSSPARKVALYGVIIVDGKKIAILQDGQSPPRNIREGDSFAGGVITAIRSNGVTFRYAGQDLNIPLGAGRTATAIELGAMGLPGGPPVMSRGGFVGGPPSSESMRRYESHLRPPPPGKGVPFLRH
ncbi:hypothetical protein CCP3SC1_80050 [Gammaproteobacteria bacterium]